MLPNTCMVGCYQIGVAQKKIRFLPEWSVIQCAALACFSKPLRWTRPWFPSKEVIPRWSTVQAQHRSPLLSQWAHRGCRAVTKQHTPELQLYHSVIFSALTQSEWSEEGVNDVGDTAKLYSASECSAALRWVNFSRTNPETPGSVAKLIEQQ